MGQVIVSIAQNLQDLTQKEVSRKEFLTIAGLAILSIFGMSTIIKLLTGQSVDHHLFTKGYGSSTYSKSRRVLP
jgi:hypothetical protein